MMRPMSTTQTCNHLGKILKPRLVMLWQAAPKVAVVCAEEDVRPSIVQRPTKVVCQMLLGTVELCVWARLEYTASPFVDAVIPQKISRLLVVPTVLQFVRYAGNINQPVVSVERISSEAEDHVANLSRASDHRFADCETQQPVLDARRATIVDCQFIEVALRHSVFSCFAAPERETAAETNSRTDSRPEALGVARSAANNHP